MQYKKIYIKNIGEVDLVDGLHVVAAVDKWVTRPNDKNRKEKGKYRHK